MPPRPSTPTRFQISDDDSELSESPSHPDFDHDGLMSARNHQSNFLPTTSKDKERRTRVRTPISYQESDIDSDIGTTKTKGKGKGKGKARIAEPPTPTPISRKRKQATPIYRGGKRKKLNFGEWDSDSDVDIEGVQLARLKPGVEIKKDDLRPEAAQHLSRLERLPTEVIQLIAILLPTDVDVVKLSAVSRRFSETIHPQNSPVWAARFLAQYDHPIITNSNQFCAAYKERYLVLNNFIDFSHGSDPRLEAQLAVLHDMVIETFYPHKPWRPSPVTSKNLSLFSNADSAWMRTFFSSPLFNNDNLSRDKPYGDSHPLFDALQVTFAHLLFSPVSRLAKITIFGREDYNIAKVYNWNAPFGTIYSRLVDEIPEPSISWRPTKLFPNLRSPSPPLPIKRFHLDTHTLLHIRNFWHRHLITDFMGVQFRMDMGEDTYHRAAEKLARLGHAPKAWSRSLLASPPKSSGSNSPFSPLITTGNTNKNKNDDSNPTEPPRLDTPPMPKGKWVGFYSTQRPWPSSSTNYKQALQKLTERQTDAEDWKTVDPLTLDLRFSPTNTEVIRAPGRHNVDAGDLIGPPFGIVGGVQTGFPTPSPSSPSATASIAGGDKGKDKRGDETVIWPDSFANIPVFERTIPTKADAKYLEDQGLGKVWYVRGIAPFMNIEAEVKEKDRREMERRELERVIRLEEADGDDETNLGSDDEDDGDGGGGGSDAPKKLRRSKRQQQQQQARSTTAGKAPPGASLRPAGPSSQEDNSNSTRQEQTLDKDGSDDVQGQQGPGQQQNKHAEATIPKYHPFTALRVRGVIHPIPWTHPSLNSTTANTKDKNTDTEINITIPSPTRRPSPFSKSPPQRRNNTTTNNNNSSSNPFSQHPPNPPLKLNPPVPIPNFNRLVLILYRPTLECLIRQLEQSLERYGGNFGVEVTQMLDAETAAVLSGFVNAGSNALNDNGGGGAGGVAGGTAGGGGGGAAFPSEYMAALQKYLAALVAEKTEALVRVRSRETAERRRRRRRRGHDTQRQGRRHGRHARDEDEDDSKGKGKARRKAKAKTKNRLATTTTTNPSNFSQSQSQSQASNQSTQQRTDIRKVWTRPTIEAIEHGLYRDGQVNWEDVEYAYAYEGVLTPGGELMMGRWWRCGVEGLAPLDGDGDGDGVVGGGGGGYGAEVDFGGVGVPDGLGFGVGEAAGHSTLTTTATTTTTTTTTTTVAAVGASAAPTAGGNANAAAAAPAPPVEIVNKNLDRGPFVFWTMADNVDEDEDDDDEDESEVGEDKAEDGDA